MSHKTRLLLCVGLALLLRVILIPNPGFEADISFWKSWGLATADYGAVEGMKLTNNNYPTPFTYTLGAMVWVYKLFADPHNFQEFWSNTNILFLTVSKMLPILADFGIAAIILYIGRHTHTTSRRLGFPEVKLSFFRLTFYELLAVMYLLNPISLMDGAWWGQVDSLGVCIFLCAVVLALKKQPTWAGVIFMLAMMTKLQNIIYAPIFFLFIWQYLGYTGLIAAIGGATLGFFGLNIEFILSKNADRVLASLTENYDYFPWMSLMAYNLWWIVSGARGLITSDKLTVLGILNAKTVGLMIFSAMYLLAVTRQLLDKTKTQASPALQTFIESLIIANSAFFLFQTQSHDRYAFPLTVFLLLWTPFFITQAGSKYVMLRTRLLGIAYIVFSVCYFYNLHTALVVNYPQNGLPLLSTLTQPFFTLSTAYIQLGLFFLFLYAIIHSSTVSRRTALFVFVILTSSLVYLNLPLIQKKPIFLTALSPFISEQAYGTRQIHKSVQSSFGGPYKWTRLSVQYLFYKHGIGTHANSKHVFDIAGKFTRFTVDYGIDTEAGTKASAIFEIYGDGTLLFRSQPMGRFDLPRHAEVNITGVRHLWLVTTDAGDNNYDDHTDWLNPILWP